MSTDNRLHFETVDARGMPVDRRISSPESMRFIYRKFQDEDDSEARRRKRLKDIYDGNLPYNPEKLRQLNLANLTNFNTGDLKGFVDTRVSAVTELSLDTCPLVELRPWPATEAGPLAERIADTIADEFSTAVRARNKLLPCLAGMFRECDLYGLGPATWKSDRDYNPVSLRRGQLKFRMDGPISSEEHEVFMFESPVTIHYFSQLFRKPEVAAKEGWDMKAIKDYLVSVYLAEQDTDTQPGDSSGTSVIESAMLEMRQNRWAEVNQFRTIRLLHAYVKEADGKIRHLICTPSAVVQSSSSTSAMQSVNKPGSEDTRKDAPSRSSIAATAMTDRFLYDKEGAFENMDQCLLWLPASVIEQEARGSRGVASIVGPISDVNNRLLCKMYDAAFREGSFTLISRSPGGHNQQSIIERGPYTLLAGDLAPATHQMQGPDIQKLSSLRELGNNIGYNNSTGQRGGLGAIPERMISSSDRKTKEEVQRHEYHQSKGEQQAIAARIMTLDKIFNETFRRFMNLVHDAKEKRQDFPEIEQFITNCELRGVPKEALKNVTKLFGVYTNRVLVTGGGHEHAGALAELIGAFGGNFDEPGRSRAMHDIVRYRLGQKSADRYRPVESRDTAASNAISFATLENGAMQQGHQTVVGNDQLHWSHVPIHMQLLSQIAQQYTEDPESIQEPQQVLNLLMAVSQHVQEHVGYGGRQTGMKPAMDEVFKQLSSLAPVVKGLTMMAGTLERQRQAAAEQQQRQMEELQQQAAGYEAQATMHESDNKAILKAREQDLMHEVRKQKVAQDGEIALMEAENEAKARIGRGSSRFRQGATIMGLGKGTQPMGVIQNDVTYDEEGNVPIE